MKQEYRIADIHCHIIYGVDDGSQDIETSMRMLKTAYDEGVRRIIFTPHYKPGRHNAGKETVSERIDRLKSYLAENGMDIELYRGSEIMYHDEASELIAMGRISTMADSRYVLTEFTPQTDYRYIYNGLMKLMSNGYMPILAHIERYRCMTGDTKHAYELRNSGVYIQVNAGSVEGRYGREAKRYTRELIEESLVDFIASDAHDMEDRAPVFHRCIRYLAKHYGYGYVEQLMWDNPAKVIEDEYI